MPRAPSNGIELEYECFGAEDAPAMVLIMGLSMQMIAWPEELCEALADGGYRVIRFDNRDCGLSHKCDGMRAPSFPRSLLLNRLGRSFETPYTLDDMALDTLGLFDHLGIDKAHVVGCSMGGMIGQILAGRYKSRVRSLTSIMSSSGHPRFANPKWKVARHMFLSRPKSSKREDIVAWSMELWDLIGSPGYPPERSRLQARIERALDRAYYPQGFLRQFSAILADGSRRELLAQIEAPSLVLHGADDALVPLPAGQDTAAHIPGARLEVIPGMGHNLPLQLIPRYAELLLEHANAADARA